MKIKISDLSENWTKLIDANIKKVQLVLNNS